MSDSNIITIFKNKGERIDYNNYRDIFLLSIVGKVFSRVILIRLQKLAERIFPESQCGFRAERSTIDMVSPFESYKRSAETAYALVHRFH